MALDKFTDIDASCRKCEACRKAKRRHWVGRINAEASTSDSVTFATFTYGDGDTNDAYFLHYEDLQKCFKRLRRRGFRFKYVAVGEYGSKKERAHFHALIFWSGKEPGVVYDRHVYYKHPWKPSQNFWPHGFLQFERPRSRQASAAYIMKYLEKDDTACLKYSKAPPLGSDYLIEYAKRHARTGLTLFLESDRFSIPDNVRSNGKLYYYPVGRHTVLYEEMICAYLREYYLHALSADLVPPLSKEVTEWIEDACQNPDRYPIEVAICAEACGFPQIPDFDYAIGDGFFYSRPDIYYLDRKGHEKWRKRLPRDAGLVEAFSEYHQQLRKLGWTRSIGKSEFKS